jgi:hypothetical protein
MWIRRWIALLLALLFQAFVIAHAINSLEEEPRTDIAWVPTFGIIILYLAISGVFLIISFVQVIMICVRTRPEPDDRFAFPETIEEKHAKRREARVNLGDALNDLILYVPLVVFFALLIDNLERWDDFRVFTVLCHEQKEYEEMHMMTLVPPEMDFCAILRQLPETHNWIGVFVPLALFGAFLSGTLLVGAIRTCGEEEMQERELAVDMCCSAAFSDVIQGCSLDHDSIEQARARVADKVDTYVANSEFHALPCSFLCTRSLTANMAEFLLNWVLFAAALTFTIDMALLGFFIEQREPSLILIFTLLWVVEILIIALGLIALVLLCCDPRFTGEVAPPRFSITHKLTTVSVSLVAALMLAVFQILLASRVVGHSHANWHIVMLPIYIVLTVALVIGCAYSAAFKTSHVSFGDGSSNSGNTNTASSSSSSSSSATTQTRARVNTLRRDVRRQEVKTPTSLWGFL